MPIPFILGGIAAAGGLFGAKKMKDSYDNNQEAKEICEDAQDLFDRAKNRLENQRNKTNSTLERLGTTRINIWSQEMHDFVTVFNKFKDLQYKGKYADDQMLAPTKEALKNMTQTSISAAELVQGGLGSVAAGTLTSAAAYGGVGFLATASTGTAISGLSGAAATNATLAWLGGGSLAAGGVGVAGGTLVLGGIALAPALAVAGIFMSSKSKENLARAEEAYEEAENAAHKMGVMEDMLSNLEELADDYNTFLLQLVRRFRKAIYHLEDVHAKYAKPEEKASFRDLNVEEQESLHVTWMLAQTMSKLLQQSLLTPENELNEEAEELLEEKRFLLEE